jgi:deoxycytidine triphosphate deaminase
VVFQSTEEDKDLGPGMYLKILPGESVTISSYEQFKFTKEEIGRIFPGCDMMALITPTMTMMREGILQAATKVDSGWSGTLNWGLRNSSIKDFILGYGEPIFKLTFFLLEGDEVPETPYGERPDDRYQHTDGVVRSTRKIPADIPKRQIVGSSAERLDPNKQLRESGYPFDHIGRELTELQGKWEVVSNDVLLLKVAITDETKKLSDKVDEAQNTVLEKVEHLFTRKFLQAIGAIVGCFSIMFGIVTFLKDHGITGTALGSVAVLGGLGVFLLIYLLSRKSHGIKA